MGAFWIFLATAFILPLAVTELSDWCPHFAKRMVTWTARRLGDADAAERYTEEWQAELADIPGKLAPIAIALTYVVKLPLMRRTIKRQRVAVHEPQTVEGEPPTGMHIVWAVASCLRQNHPSPDYQGELRRRLLEAVLAGSDSPDESSPRHHFVLDTWSFHNAVGISDEYKRNDPPNHVDEPDDEEPLDDL